MVLTGTHSPFAKSERLGMGEWSLLPSLSLKSWSSVSYEQNEVKSPCLEKGLIRACWHRPAR